MTLGMQTQLSIPFNNQDWSTPRHQGVLKIICRLCNVSNLWNHECKCELFVNSLFKTKWFVNRDL